jgi:hypothetical protein
VIVSPERVSNLTLSPFAKRIVARRCISLNLIETAWDIERISSGEKEPERIAALIWEAVFISISSSTIDIV